MGINIVCSDVYLPDKILSNDDLAKQFEGFNAKKVSKKIGISERHIAGEDETALDLAERACSMLFDSYDRQKVDFLIFCTQSPEYILPTTACVLQNRLGLRTDIGAFDYNLGCSGYVYGLAMAKSLIAGGMALSVLLVTAETYSKYIHPQDRSNRSIFGDAATATIIEASDKEGIGEFVFGTDGSGADNLIVRNGASKNPYDSEALLREYSPGNFSTDNYLYMNGPDIFNFTIEAVPKAVEACLSKNKVTFEDIDLVILHQANKYMLNYLKLKMGIPDEKFFIAMEGVGNTVSNSIPIALKMAMENAIMATGGKVLLVGFGVGYSWSAAIITF